MKLNDVYILVGSPAAGKSWVSSQLKDKFDVVEHDDYKDMSLYLRVLSHRSKGDKPVLANTPFGLSRMVNHLEALKIKVHPVFIIEDPQTLRSRYSTRGHGAYSENHLKRQLTYQQRAREMRAFSGNSTDVLNYLKAKELK